jgi:hypothetical protein
VQSRTRRDVLLLEPGENVSKSEEADEEARLRMLYTMSTGLARFARAAALSAD